MNPKFVLKSISRKLEMSQTQAILDNFIQHTAQVPDQTDDMQVLIIGHLTVVNSGLSCDTFNIIHVTGSFTSKELEEALATFKEQEFPFCLWISEEYVEDPSLQLLKKAGLQCQAQEAGMILDLSNYDPIVSDKHLYIQKATSRELINDFSQVIAKNWSPPDEQVLAFYEKTATQFLSLPDQVSLLTYYQEDKPVATVEVFASRDEVVGIHGLATLEDTRGQGIGSALMTKALNDAKATGYKKVVLLATEDGSGIYQKLGFKTLTTFYEYA